MKDLEYDKPRPVAIVTGSSHGLGKEIALALAANNFDLAVVYQRDRMAATEVIKKIQAYGVSGMALRYNVCKWQQANQMIQKVYDKMGRVDILINNVGAFLQKSFEQISIQDWHDMIDSNLNSVFYCCKAIEPFLKQQCHGRIINIGLANVNRIHAYKQIIPYAIAKTGVLVLTRSLAAEWANYGITINIISPGLMNNGDLSIDDENELSKKVPMGRVGVGKDITAAILYLVSDAAEYVTGTEIIVSGGWGL